MARRRYIRRGASKADGGASWISYSDMMAALLLVFVLVLCYSVYQYFLMLETKTAELDEQSALLTQQQATLDEQREELTAQQAALTDKQNELTAALTQLDEKESLLNDQSLTLEEQEKIILAAQTALSQKEEELNAANQELTNKQQELADATILLGQQQDTLNAQQQKLDDLVGVRTEIVRDLTAALSQADLKATVDGNTGDIMLESAVFFDVAKSNIKDSGRALLDEFIPVYLGVLLMIWQLLRRDKLKSLRKQEEKEREYQKNLLEEVKKADPTFEYEFHNRYEPDTPVFVNDENSEIVKAIDASCEAVCGRTPKHFTKVGGCDVAYIKKAIGGDYPWFGPGTDEIACADEKVSIENYLNCIMVYMATLVKMLG